MVARLPDRPPINIDQPLLWLAVRDKSACTSRRIISADDPAFALHTSNLPYVLAVKFQPDARSHAIRFLDYDHAEMFQAPADRLDIKAGLDPCTAACLQPMERIDRNSRSCSEVCLTDAGQGTSCSDQTASDPNLIVHPDDAFLRGS